MEGFCEWKMKHINLGIVAHVDAGKTTLTEALLYKTGNLRRLGRVDTGDSFLDTNDQERERGITIFSKQAELKTDDINITLVDTPGHVDFSAEAECVLQILDYCILVVSAAEGIRGHTLTLWSLLEKYNVPVIVFVNKMDQPGADKDAVMADLRDRFSDSFLDMSDAYTGDEGFTFDSEILENIAMCDEALMEEYLDSLDASVISPFRIAVLIKERKLVPVFFGSALKLEGMDALWRGLSDYTVEEEYPDDFAARVFKISRDTSGNRLTHLKVMGGSLKVREIIGEEKINQLRVYSGDRFETVQECAAGHIVAVTGLNNTVMGMGLGALRGVNTPLMEPVLNYRVVSDDGTDDATLLSYLKILEEEDPQLTISFEENTKEIRVRVMGDIQLQVLTRTMKDRFGCSVVFDTGSVVYKETIANAVEGVGHFEPLRHYAEAHLILTPMPRGSGMSYDTDCSEDILSRNWQRLILTHLKERMHRGVLTGAPITDMKITLITGRAHLKHTEGGDFRQATYRAVRQGLMCARSVLLEPYYYYRIELPTVNVGRAMTDLERMNGSPSAPEIEGDTAVLTGTAPVVCIQNYAEELAIYSGGMGNISLSLAGYEECHNAKEVIEASGYLPEADLKNTPDSVFCAHGAGVIVSWNEVRTYMHVESPVYVGEDGCVIASGEGDRNYEGENREGESFAANRMIKAEASHSTSIGTDEIDAILNRTFYANSDSSAAAASERRKGVGDKGRVVSTGGQVRDPYADYRYSPVERRKKYLVVDGYNIVHAWNELKELAAVNLDSARDRLIDIMSNLQGVSDSEIILVFDAYKVKGRTRGTQKIQNLTIVYTSQDETADSYIERFAAKNGRTNDVTVATSDNLEGSVAFGSKCNIMSAPEFYRYVNSTLEQITQDYRINNREEKVYLDVNISP